MALNPKYIDSTGLVSGLPLVTDGIKGVIYGTPYVSTTGGTITGDLVVTGNVSSGGYSVLTTAGGSITGNLAITGTLTINGVEVTPGAQPYTYDTDYKCLIFS